MSRSAHHLTCRRMDGYPAQPSLLHTKRLSSWWGKTWQSPFVAFVDTEGYSSNATFSNKGKADRVLPEFWGFGTGLHCHQLAGFEKFSRRQSGRNFRTEYYTYERTPYADSTRA
ncbi:predicted protein [Coccidioides posadasii str. Silveira]|uniref:Predicted protein n=2 Tax=Coccidioides posadasii TaxID=199306 RepID=E9DHS8_COCPS|nr:predicted protein [Coccidioides posadasii str. Silveira]KMM69482.1 hypothetical protein CPAG_05797 [Coccidioides posadasii RMSCC 3488]